MIQNILLQFTHTQRKIIGLFQIVFQYINKISVQNITKNTTDMKCVIIRNRPKPHQS